MEGKLTVIKDIPFVKYKNPARYKKLLRDDFTRLMLEERDRIAKKYDEKYTVCYYNEESPIDMELVPDGITVVPVSYVPPLHVLFVLTDEKE